MCSITLLTNVEPDTVFNNSYIYSYFLLFSKYCFYLQNYHYFPHFNGEVLILYFILYLHNICLGFNYFYSKSKTSLGTFEGSRRAVSHLSVYSDYSFEEILFIINYKAE